MCLLAEGVDTKTIAAELSITPKTVATHINNAMQKLDVHTRAQAVALAHQLGLVDARAQLSDNETQELEEGATLG